MSTRPAPEIRLAISRERIRLALCAPPSVPTPNSKAPGAGWLDALLAEPGTGLVLEALGLWWARHPMHSIGTQWAQTFRTALTPMAQRNPAALILAAFAVGGLIALAKPWRWISAPQAFAGALPQVLVNLVAQVPPATWLKGLDALLRSGLSPEVPEQKGP